MGVPHGLANSIILPHAMRFNADATGLEDVKSDFSDMQQELRDGLREAENETPAPPAKTGSGDAGP